MSSIVQTPKRDRWAHLRFSIIGALLAAPPAPGSLMASLQALAAKPWRHPDTGLDIRFSAATLERWYYAARRGADPVAVLRDRKRDNVGQFPSLNPQLIEALTTQYREHPGWTMQLHFDNLLSQWSKLKLYVTSGEYPIDNNACENSIRPFVIGRRNWLFADTVAGANASANLYSLLQTCAVNGVDGYKYLRALLASLPKAQTADDYEALLPWNIALASD